ncbi:MAG: AAA family ATPase [Armatimonadota bacterium]
MPVRILIAENDPIRKNTIRDLIRDIPECEVVGIARDGEEAIQQTVMLSPAIALISCDLPGISGIKSCDIINAISPDTMVAILSDSDQHDKVDSAMRSGARAFIPNPPDLQHLHDIISELSEVSKNKRSADYQDWKNPDKYSKIVSITAGKGGVGKTTICSNLAVTLAKRYNNKVILVDLYSQFGDIATMLNLAPKLTITDMSMIHCDLDPELIRNYITRHASGVNVLTTSNKPIQIDSININFLEDLLYILKQMYKFIIIDIPPFLHSTSTHVLRMSNRIFLVSNLMDLTAITDTRKFIDALQSEDVPNERIEIILNRISKTNNINLADVEQALARNIIAGIPEDTRVVNSINEGVPLVLSDADSNFNRSFQEIADKISHFSDNHNTNDVKGANR